METATRLYTVKEAAIRLHESPASVYGLCAANLIRHERRGVRGGKILIPEEAIEEYRRRRTVDIDEPHSPQIEEPAPKEKLKGLELW